MIIRYLRKLIYFLVDAFSVLVPGKHSRPEPAKHAVLYLHNSEPVAEIDKRYLSFSVDISVLVGGFWWEGTNDSRRGLGTLRTLPLNLNSAKLDRLVKLLGPAYLRVGGSEADKIHYFENPEGDADALVLTTQQWDDLHSFISRNDLKLIFTCKYGLFKREHQGRWQGQELLALLDYSNVRGYQIDVFELGNELNAYWAFHGVLSQPRAIDLARDYGQFYNIVKSQFPKSKISGPGSAFWPKLGETVKPISNITPRFLANLDFKLDIVDWHYYPFQSDRSPIRTRSARLHHLLDPKSFEYFGKYSKRLSALRTGYQPHAELWTGETGSAQCGGQPELSDRWVSSFWWADQLGMGAKLGQKVMVRQSLIGGDYGMIARLTLKPRPDYWVSWLWAQLMGRKVFAIESGSPHLRCYLHSAKGGKGKTLMLINLAAHVVSLDFVSEQRAGVASEFIVEGYELTAKSLLSRRVRLNGQKLRFKSGTVALDDFQAIPFTGKVSPYSISFWRFESA
ncbi:glycoside hydrolase [Spongiibacter sp. KMU-158]|uniref:Glycoside hydrolase n=1 Tax=Spongiibacter pelagi TaxID=2760804 RepID=A0A927C292_9GAMM|nr:glycoside hydrolase [Spongiibacter pelagi]MBD2859419.1 glycoside hydrolase [Spongiibacter pelagi]